MGITGDVTEVCKFIHDPDCTQFPEVYQAWKSAGQEDNMPTVALYPAMGQWAIGFGGKKNADRAAKLALAVTIAAVTEPQKLLAVVRQYPQFGQMCTAAGVALPQ